MGIFQREDFSENLFSEIHALAQKHHAEVSIFASQATSPSFSIYQALADAHILRIFTAREEETKALIGYSVFFLTNDHHFKDALVAKSDLLFMDEAFRGHGLELIRFSDRALFNEGISHIYRSASPLGKSLETVFEKLGYTLAETVFIKQKGKE